jgi:hypothetical protein
VVGRVHSPRHYKVRFRRSQRLRYRLPRLLFAAAKPLVLILAVVAALLLMVFAPAKVGLLILAVVAVLLAVSRL